MVAIKGRFDGKVFVPDEAVDLPRDQRVVMHIESVGALPPGTPAADLLQFVGMISDEDLKLMSDAIEEGCERVDPDGW